MGKSLSKAVKSNKKLAKQMALSGKARRRQELEDRRLLHNRQVKSAVAYAELRRNNYLRAQLDLLAPFVQGAKRSLQMQLGIIAQQEVPAAAPSRSKPPQATRSSRRAAGRA